MAYYNLGITKFSLAFAIFQICHEVNLETTKPHWEWDADWWTLLEGNSWEYWKAQSSSIMWLSVQYYVIECKTLCKQEKAMPLSLEFLLLTLDSVEQSCLIYNDFHWRMGSYSTLWLALLASLRGFTSAKNPKCKSACNSISSTCQQW